MKKGAFASLRAVKPFSAKTWSLGKVCPNDGGGLNFYNFLAVGCQTIAWTFTQQEMPVFEPNEYFWKHHWDGKEDKWRAYARAVQQVIADQSGLEVSDCWVEDKLEYKQWIKAQKKKSD